MRHAWIGRTVLALAAVAVASGAAAQEATRAYVANRGAMTVTVVDVVTGAVTKTIQLDAPPYDVVATEDRVFVSLPTVNRVAVINPATLTVVGAIAVPGAPRDLDRRPQAPRLLISTDLGLRIHQWSDGTLEGPIAVGPGQFKAVEAGHPAWTGQVYVAACDGGATVRSVSEASQLGPPPVATGAMPCAVLNTATAVYVANTGDDTVTVFTPLLQSPTTVAVADQPIGFAETSAGIWVASAGGTLTLLDRTSHAVLTTRVIGGTPTAIASTLLPAAPPDEVLLVTDAAGTLRVLSATGDVLRTATTGAGPGGVDIGDGNPIDPLALTSSGSWSNAVAVDASMSLDGRFVAFASEGNIVAGDTNGLTDVFVRDRLLSRTARVSVTSAGGQADGALGPFPSGFVRAAPERRRPLRALSVGRHQPGRRRRQRPRGHLPARP